MVRGPTPTSTKLTTVITPAVIRAAVQPAPQVSTATRATSVVAVSSHSSRSSNRSATWCGTLRATACSVLAPRTPSRTISVALASDTWLSAASVIAKTPASTTRPPAVTRSAGSFMRESDLGSPGLQQATLQAEHLPLLLGLGVVVPEQMQDAMDGEQVQLVLGPVPGGAGLPLGHHRAEHHVAEERRLGLVLDTRAAVDLQLVHGEGEHIGRAGLAHPAVVQLGHVLGVDQQQRQLGHRVDAHLVERVPGDRQDLRLVDGEAGLVRDLDRHRLSPSGPDGGPAPRAARSRWCSWRPTWR